MGSGFGWVHWAGVGLWLGGVGWGGVITFIFACKHTHWPGVGLWLGGMGWGGVITFIFACKHTHWDGVGLWLGGVGWGGVITFIFACKHTHWDGVGLWLGGVGWGNNVHLRLQTRALTWGRALNQKKWTPLRREALLQAMLKTPHIRTTSEHSHVEKNIRCFFPGSTCRSLHVKNTTRSDHFWTLCKRFVWQTDGNRSKQAKCRTTWKVHFGRLKPVSTQK